MDEYLDVFRREGGKYLQTYRTPVMTWDEVKAMKGAGTTGLGIGFHAPGEGHLGGEKDTNHARLEGGATAGSQRCACTIDSALGSSKSEK